MLDEDELSSGESDVDGINVDRVGTTVSLSADQYSLRKKKTFPAILYGMMMDPVSETHICWNEAGTSIIVLDKDILARDILGRHFLSSRFES
jgi:hypothetical protein